MLMHNNLKMNKLLKYIIVIVLLITGAEVFSQPPAFRNRQNNMASPYRKVEAAKEKYVDRQLDLSDDEASKFWPVYRQYTQEINKIRKLKRQNMLSNRSADQTEKDIYYEQQLVDIKKRYNQEFLRILPPEKVSKIYRSEREFTDELIKIYGERGNPES
jgi:hypothetical protein